MQQSKIRRGSPFQCLLCYLVAFSLPLLWLALAIWVLYPYRLAGTAPNVAANVLSLIPGLRLRLPWLADLANAGAQGGSPQALRLALQSREQVWLLFIAGCGLAAWLLTLLLQLLWRVRFHSAVCAARRTRTAIRSYRLTMLLGLLINAFWAFVVWKIGVCFIDGRTLWDYLTYFLPYALHWLAMGVVCRLAAPAAISGRHGFFQRI